MGPALADFLPLTPSQRKVGKYFLVVAALFLVQIGAGTLMAHSYCDRTSFYGININALFPFNFLRDVHIQAPIVWISLAWIGAALFLAPAIAGGREVKAQGLLVDILFYVAVLIVAGGLVGDYFGIMGRIDAYARSDTTGCRAMRGARATPGLARYLGGAPQAPQARGPPPPQSSGGYRTSKPIVRCMTQ